MKGYLQVQLYHYNHKLFKPTKDFKTGKLTLGGIYQTVNLM